MDLERRYHKWFNFVGRVLSMTALWPDQEKKGIYEVIRKIIAIAIGIFTILVFISAVNYCHFYYGNLAQLMRGFSLIGTAFLMWVKIVIFIVDREMIAELIKTLNTMWAEELKDAILRPILFGHLKSLSRFSYLQTIAVGGTVAGHLIGPITGILYGKFTNTPITYVLPFPVKVPWEISGRTMVYPANYFLSIITGWSIFSAVVGPDGLFCLLVLQITGLLRVVAFRMRNLSSDKDYENEFRKCVERHSILTQCVKNLQKVYGFIILTQFLSNALVMCALMFQASRIEVITFARIMIYGLYISSKLVQTLMYSWCGELLTSESEEVSHAAYKSDWILKYMDIKMKRNILMVIGKRPFVLTACYFTRVSFTMFTKIINTTASYFFMLKAVDSK